MDTRFRFWPENCKSEGVLLARPPLPVTLLVAIAMFDLVLTTVLFCFGLIEELNPLMRPLLHTHPALFVVVKLATIVAAFIGLQWYRQFDERFVRLAAGCGATVYSVVWVSWCIGAHI